MLVQEVHLLHRNSAQDYVAIVELFYSVLAKHLPKLTNVIITTPDAFDGLSFHPYFTHARVQAHTVTTLKLAHVSFIDTFELDHLLMPFPSLHTLDMYDVFRIPWDPDNQNRLPRSSKVIPSALADLRIGYRGTESKVRRIFLSHSIPHDITLKLQFVLDGPFNLVGLDQFLCSVSRTLKTLSLNLPVTRAFTMVPQCT